MDRRQFSSGAGVLLLAGCATGNTATNGDSPPDEANIGMPPADRGEIAGLPFEWIRFTKEGEPTPRIPTLLQEPTITDFIVLSHGWLTDLNGAWRFYKPLLENVVRAWTRGDAPEAADRRYAVLGVSWPSKEWGARSRDPVEDIVRAVSREPVSRLNDAALQRAVASYAAFTGADPLELLRLAQDAVGGGLQQAHCEALMHAAMAPLATQTDVELGAERAPYDARQAQQVMRRLSEPVSLRFDPAIARMQGIDAEQRGRYRGGVWGISRLFNFCTYWEMKARAGVIGKSFADYIMPLLQEASGVARVHFIGHSFGARLVTAVSYHAAASAKLQSLLMLQGAFSHHALAERGAFHGAHRKISGPTLITHTHRDLAVTRFYPLASLFSGDTGRRLGGPDDNHGAVGANGALLLGADAVTPAPVSTANPAVFTLGKVHNMNCDACIAGHTDVKNAEVARIVATAIALGA